jgi:hypothetical protein
VTDLPADFDVALQGVDTRLKALQPGTTLGDIAYSSATANTNTRLGIGTTGQVLTVASGVPSWATPTAGMTNPMTTTGDTIYSSSGSTPARLGIGTAGQFLAVNSGATAPEWVAAPSAGSNFTLLNAGGTALTGATVVTVSGISGKDKIFIRVDSASAANASSQIGIRLNTATTNYSCNLIDMEWTTTYSNANYDTTATTPTSLPLAIINSTAAGLATGSALITGANSSGVKVCQVFGGGAAMGAQGGQRNRMGQHLYTDSATISSISIVSSSGNLDAGTVYVYTSA